MSNTQQVEYAFCVVEVVDHAVIANTQSESLDPFQSMMWVAVKSRAQTVNRGFDSGLNGNGQFEEVSVEVARINLQRGAHDLARFGLACA
jgi:hypothetical protein